MLFGTENQTEIDKDMPLRVISHDGAMYRAQRSFASRYKIKNKRDKMWKDDPVKIII